MSEVPLYGKGRRRGEGLKHSGGDGGVKLDMFDVSSIDSLFFAFPQVELVQGNTNLHLRETYVSHHSLHRSTSHMQAHPPRTIQ